jgi:hypothetical protein
MAMITIRIDDVTERRFRELAKKIHGDDKGSLDRAAAEAFSLWILDKEEETIARQGPALLGKEHHLGKYGFNSRKDIHDRMSRSD